MQFKRHIFFQNLFSDLSKQGVIHKPNTRRRYEVALIKECRINIIHNKTNPNLLSFLFKRDKHDYVLRSCLLFKNITASNLSNLTLLIKPL